MIGRGGGGGDWERSSATANPECLRKRDQNAIIADNDRGKTSVDESACAKGRWGKERDFSTGAKGAKGASAGSRSQLPRIKATFCSV